jgi:hypothetical protein
VTSAQAISILVEPFDPNRYYIFCFVIVEDHRRRRCGMAPVSLCSGFTICSATENTTAPNQRANVVFAEDNRSQGL